MNHYRSNYIITGYTLKFKIEQVENKLSIAMNEHFEKLHLQGMTREEKMN